MKKVVLLVLAVAMVVVAFAACQPVAPVTPDAPVAPVETAKPVEETPVTPDAPVAPTQVLAGKKIAFVNAGPDDYYAQFGDLFKIILAAEGCTDFTEVNSDYNPDTELKNVQDAIVAKADAIVVITAQADGSNASAKAAKDAGIPIFFALGEPTDKTNYTAWCGDDFISLGYNVGKFAAEKFAGQTWVSIDGQYGQTTAEQQCEGFIKAWAEADPAKYAGKDWKEFSLGSAGWQREPAYKMTQDLIASKKAFDGIFAGNSEEAFGVVQALEEAGLEGKKWVVTINGKAEDVEYVRQGRIAGTTPNPPPMQVEVCISQMKQFFTDPATVLKRVPIVPQIAVVTKENCDSNAVVPWGAGTIDKYMAGRAAGYFEVSADFYYNVAKAAGLV